MWPGNGSCRRMKRPSNGFNYCLLPPALSSFGRGEGEFFVGRFPGAGAPVFISLRRGKSHQRRANFLYTFSVFEFVFACLAWFAVHLIRLPATFFPARRRNFSAYLNSR